ncbi:MAG: dihydrolipoyl dehydrogenase family protein, partial [Kiloniellales bacterium]
MSQDLKADICVIGGGSAGLTIAAGASQMGAKTVLIEQGRMGGDCLNYGCVPSKSLLAAGKAAVFHRHAAAFGVGYAAPEIDFRAVQAHVQGVIDAIAPHDSVGRFEGLGVTVIKAMARFVGPDTLVAGDSRVTARRFVIATGSQPLVPPIPGLGGIPYLTNETVFALSELPKSLLVIGGGPIGCELGQAFRHLGAEVAVVEMAGILPKDDPELVEVVRKRLLVDGLELLEGAQVAAAEKSGEGIALTIERDGKRERREAAALLIAAGRRPTLDGLGLDAAGVATGKSGIEVDARLRTTNRKIF